VRNEGQTCYEQDEKFCEDQMCLRTGCRLQNERHAVRPLPLGQPWTVGENELGVYPIYAQIGPLRVQPAKAFGLNEAGLIVHAVNRDHHFDAMLTALRRIQSLDAKNVAKYAQEIASTALKEAEGK
jgi:hypothetical protein